MGVGGQLIQWPPDIQEALIAQGFEIILVDNRDVGLSSKLNHLGTPNIWKLMWKQTFGLSMTVPYTLEDMAVDYIDLLDHLHIKHCHVLGISMGSMIAQILAAKYPERISTVTLVHTGTGKSRHSIGIKPRAIRTLAARGNVKSEQEYAQHFEQLFSVVGSPGLQRPSERLQEVGRLLFQRSYSPDGFKRQFAAILATGDRENITHTFNNPHQLFMGIAIR